MSIFQILGLSFLALLIGLALAAAGRSQIMSSKTNWPCRQLA